MNPSETIAEPAAQQQIQQRKARRMMLAIVAAFVLPFFVLPLVSSPELVGKTNKGILIQPHVPLADLGLLNVDGSPFDVAGLDSRWTLFYVIPDNCAMDCLRARDHALYAMRQVRLSLDRDVDRVQSLLVFPVAPEATLAAMLEKEFSHMKSVRGDTAVLQAKLFSRIPMTVSPAGHIFLMSPDGYVFMAYPTFSDEQESILRARDIRSDLKKSLKGDRHL